MPIRLRLAFMVALITILIVVAGGIAFDAALGGGIKAAIERSLTRRAGRIEADISAHLLPLIGASAGNTASKTMLTLQPDQSLVQVIGSAGDLAYATQVAGTVPLVAGFELGQARKHAVWLERRNTAWKNAHLLLAEADPAHPGEVIVVGASMDQINDSLRRLHDALFIGGPLLVLLATAGAWLLARDALQPVERLRAQAAMISSAGLDAKLAVPGTRDELAALAATLNALLARLHASQSRQRDFVAAASHELRTPLAALKAEIEMAGHPGRNPADLQDTLDEVDRRIGHLIHLSESLLMLAQGDEGVLLIQPVLQPLEPLVARSLAAYQSCAERKGVNLLLDADGDVECVVDGMRFCQVVENLLDNAIRYAPAKSFVEVSLRYAGSMAVLEVVDHGSGIPEDFLPRVFERFSRADPSRALGRPVHYNDAGQDDAGQDEVEVGESTPGGSRNDGGSGLGLAIVRMLVEQSGGTVAITNLPAGGTRVTVQIPLVNNGEVDDPAGRSSESELGSVGDVATSPGVRQGTDRE